MGMGFAPTWLRQVSPPPTLLHKTTLTTAPRLATTRQTAKRGHRAESMFRNNRVSWILVQFVSSFLICRTEK